MSAPFTLTPGERSVLMRRRNGRFGRGIDQRTLAERLGITRRTLQLAEKDLIEFEQWPKPLKDFVAPLKDPQLKPHEQCYLLRRRSKESIMSLATKLGVTKFWVQQMELGRENCKLLTDYHKI